MSDGRGSSSFEEAHFHRRAEATPITNYDGFSNLKAYLKEQKAQGCENVPRLMLKYSKVDAPTQPSTADMFPPKANEDRQFPHNEITGVSFVYENVPLPGWRKELVLRIVGNSAGRIEVYYANPTREKRFRSRQELQTYLEAEIMKTNPNNTNPNNVSLIINSTLNNFDFKPVFCVCQCSEDPFRNYIECSYGKIGCSKWIHPECVGLGSRSKTELDSFPKVICPFCTIYLRGCGYDSFVPKNRIKLLDKFSTRFELHDTYLEPDNELIEETNCPHRIWGLDDFTLTYYHESEIVGDAVKGGGKGLSSSLPQTAYHADYDKKSSKTAANTTSSSNNNTSNQVLLYHSDQHISKWRRKIYDETKEKMIMVGVVGGYAVTEDDQPDNQIMRTRIKQRILEKQRQSQETERKRLFTATGSHYHSINSVIGLKRGANTSSLSFNENNSYYYPPPAPPIIHYKTNLDDLICRSFLNYQLNKKRNFIANQHLFNIAPIAYHNQEDGGIRIITTVTSTRSLHDLCKNGLCGLCLQPLLLPSMTTTTTTSAVTSGNGRGKKNKTTTDEGNSNGDAALTVPLTEICNFGAVSYELHRHCAFLLNHEGELLHSIMKQFPHLSTQPSPSSASSLNKQEEGERRQKEEDQGDDSQEKKEDNCTEQTEVAKEEDEEEVNKENDNDHQGCCDEYGCKINRYYYDDIDDAKCDDCQKPGAVLLTWDTSKASYNLHLLCLFHLIRRKWLLNRQKNFIALEEEESEKHVITEENKDTVMEVEEVQKEVMSDERVKDEEEEKNESKQVDESSAMEIADNDEASSQIKEKEPNETITIIDDVPEKQEETEREGEREEQENSLKVESVSTNIEVIDLIDSPSTEKVKIEDPETTEGKIPEEDDQNAVLNQSASMETKQTSHISQNHAQISNHYATPSNLPSSSSFVEDFSVLHCRCMICGSHDGRIIRCCGANCHIRAHLICASYTKEWKIITLHNPSIISKNKKNHAKDMAVVKAIGFVCSTHRIFDSTVEDEEEIDYFKK